jgi:hypothetical protein
MTASIRTRYAGYRFPAEIIGHAVWLYFRLTLLVPCFTEAFFGGREPGWFGAQGRRKTPRAPLAARARYDGPACGRSSSHLRQHARNRKFADSMLERNGFEISVPRCLATAKQRGRLHFGREWRLLEPPKQLYRFAEAGRPDG